MVKIISDSTCDLSPQILEDLNISIMPLTIIAGDNEFKDSIDMKPIDLFRHVDVNGEKCKTAAVNVFEYQQIFAKYANEFDAIIHVNIGSKFSACHQNAVIASQDFSNVFVIDSKNLSSGHGHVVYDAAVMAKNGASAEEIINKIETEIPNVNTSFILDRLDYMHKGGRCSGFELFGSKLLNIKPCIQVIDGEMGIGKKYRGKLDKVLEQYVSDRLSENKNLDLSKIFITHSPCDKDLASAVKEVISRYAKFEQIIEIDAGCTVCNHCGPNTLGIIYKTLG